MSAYLQEELALKGDKESQIEKIANEKLYQDGFSPLCLSLENEQLFTLILKTGMSAS